jgi:hypothetical protein
VKEDITTTDRSVLEHSKRDINPKVFGDRKMGEDGRDEQNSLFLLFPEEMTPESIHNEE